VRKTTFLLVVGMLLALLPMRGWSQTMTDRSEMDQLEMPLRN